MMGALRDFIRSEQAVTAIEYGGIAGVMLVVIVTGASSLGSTLSTMWETIHTAMEF